MFTQVQHSQMFHLVYTLAHPKTILVGAFRLNKCLNYKFIAPDFFVCLWVLRRYGNIKWKITYTILEFYAKDVRVKTNRLESVINL